MKLTTGILAAVLMSTGSWAQNPNIITNVQNKMTAVQQKEAADSNTALGLQDAPASAQATKPSPAAPAPAVKPAVIPVTNSADANKLASAAPVKSGNASQKPAAGNGAPKASNQVERVNVVHHGDDVQIEITTREAVTPHTDKLTSPDRVVVVIPATAMATEQSKIVVGSSGVKAVRIGMNGKTPPATSVVVDLDHALAYELSPGPSNNFVLTLHGKGDAQVAATTTKTVATPVETKTQPKQAASAKPVAAPAPKVAVMSAPVPAPKGATTAKVAIALPTPKTAAPAKTAATPAPVAAKATVTVPAPKAQATAKAQVPKETIVAASKPQAKTEKVDASKTAADDKLPPIGTSADASKAPKPEDKKWAMTGKRDPFFSPIVQQVSGSGCATGKKCLEIGQINVRGIVKSEAGFIAVVTNSMNKAYFLHENDPVFNGYVMRITGDSVVFQETYQDKLGKPVTREVTKRVLAPAV